MYAVLLLQIGSALVLNIGFTWLVGAWLARRWIAPDARPLYLPALRRWDLAAAGLAIAGSMLSLWAATAVMGDTGLDEAAPMVQMMLTSTSYGHAGAFATSALLVVLACRLTAMGGEKAEALCVAALLGFVLARASMGHAGESGWVSGAMLAETVHYAAAGIWTGAVAVSGWLVLHPRHAAALGTAGASRYLDCMSMAATYALAAIIITGLYSGWHRVGAVQHLSDTTYGLALLAKVFLVLVAVALGGYNKVFGLPWAARSARGLLMVRRVLQAETFVLFGVLAVAGFLVSQQPPAAM